MARLAQIERFFEGTGVQVNDLQQGRDGFIYLTNGDLGLTLEVEKKAEKRPALVITFEKRL